MQKALITKEVVAAIIIHEGKVFAAQRSEEDARYLQYEFPGGKIDAGETKEAALRREINEELELEITNLQEFTFIEHNYEVFILRMTVFIAEVVSPTFTLNVHAGGGFFTLNELKSLPFLGADKLVLFEFLNSRYAKRLSI